jgi:sugar/nucleoside kinase (ribokinase family)
MTMGNNSDVVVAGHICLDIIPTFASDVQDVAFGAGKLISVGPAIMALGGSVANSGLALHRLGSTPRLMGKVGDDQIGQLIIDALRDYGNELAEGMLVEPGAHSSYSVVISPPGVDRTFFHHPGANDTFDAHNIAVEQMKGIRLFHFGYPPLMRWMYLDGGRAFAEVLHRLKEEGVTTSLDMALPDPNTEAGQVDWQAWLVRVLPEVDIFQPSVDELVYMLNGRVSGGRLGAGLLSEMAERCLQWGTAIVAIKLGSEGLYMRSTGNSDRIARRGRAFGKESEAWRGRELLAPCFLVDVAGTTGSGDCTIAGMLMAILQGQEPEEALTSAVAVGACSVEQADATSGVVEWARVQQRIENGWVQRATGIALTDWQQQGTTWYGPADARRTER